MSDFYLLDHHVSLNSSAVRPWYVTRNKKIRLLTVHTAENLPDFDGNDSGAERIAAYGATSTISSWHQTIDSDSGITMLPDEYTAWHVRGYNSEALGVEIATQAAKWATVPAVWKAAVMVRLAKLLAYWCVKHSIPAKLLTKAEVDAGEAGIVGHHLLDPSRRTDPGAAFDWPLLLRLVNEELAGGLPTMKTYNEIVAELSANEIPVWSEEAVALYVQAGGTTVPTSMTRPAFRFDIAWFWHKFVRPLDARIKNLEGATSTAASVDAVVVEVIRRLSNG